MQRALALLCLCSAAAEAFKFDLPARGRKCFNEELPHDYELAGRWSAAPGYSQFIDVRITDPHGAVIQEDLGKDKAEFRIMTSVAGDHTVCFYNRLVQGVPYNPSMKRTISFELQEGSGTKDYDQIARVDHLKPIEVNLRMMEDTVRSIHAEYQYFKEREATMRETSESTNSRAMWITVGSMVSFFLFGTWQVRHLKKYFKEKKLI
eukprot:TRINITY_DN13536_c0_g2_i1.p2 TRINITY_DN13536_c0_g2~~TRINITY_DN13536_c0_g2_i1.p2  ORF type:complete len:237 (+),score=101.86 TRINITY_DN13536_c0_g2_i1:96-713(+)